jgi:hypothetical protein
MVKSPIEVPVVGVTFRGSDYPANIFAVGRAIALAGRPLRAHLIRESHNPVDPNAIKVAVGERHVGYVPKQTAKELSALMDGGHTLLAVVDRIIVSPENADRPGLRLRVFDRGA